MIINLSSSVSLGKDQKHLWDVKSAVILYIWKSKFVKTRLYSEIKMTDISLSFYLSLPLIVCVCVCVCMCVLCVYDLLMKNLDCTLTFWQIFLHFYSNNGLPSTTHLER